MPKGAKGSGDSSNTRESPRVEWGPNTWNNPSEEDVDRVVLWFHQECGSFRCQEEVGENGNYHLQFWVKLRKKQRFTALKAKWPEVHWEPTHKSEEAQAYCSDPNKRKEDGRVWARPRLFVPLKPKHEELKRIEKLLNEEPHPRHIHWFVDEKGGVGKTEFVKYMIHTYPDQVDWTRSTQAADIKMAYNGKEMFLIDFTRASNPAQFNPWPAIEEIKDGLISDTKLKKSARTVCACRPHIIIFANSGPQIDTLSADKWIIKDITDEGADICDSDEYAYE